LSQRRAVKVLLAALVVLLLSPTGGSTVLAVDGEQDAEAIITRFRELLTASGSHLVIVPFPNSRSRILKADGSSDFFLYLERANLRGNEEMEQFYAALDAGDTAGADAIFVQHSLVSMRISDYGWNGLGVPMMTESGNEIQDRLFKNVDGVFGPAEISAEDTDTYLEYIRDILIPALEGGS
jgi:hypothetical protein